MADKMLTSTGHEEITLSSLSSSDYSCLKDLVYYLIDTYGEKFVNVALPSLRIDAFSLDVMKKVQDVKYKLRRKITNPIIETIYFKDYADKWLQTKEQRSIKTYEM